VTDYRRIAAVEGDGPNPAALTEAIDCLEAGGFLVHPTSTVYGIGGPTDREADAEINRIKDRQADTPLIRLADSIETLRADRPEVTWDERAEKLAAEFWPGSLTLVLPDGTPSGIGFRVDSHPLILQLLASWRQLLSSTSLNPTGSPPCRTPASVSATLKGMTPTGRPVIFLDAGPLPRGRPSTVVSLLERPARVLREGAVTVGELQQCIGEVLSG
jgi:L-threonylcarbamoyladenylate synthase